MSDDGLYRGQVVGEFCAIRTGPSEKCKKDGNNYVKNARRPRWDGTPSRSSRGLVRRVDKPFEPTTCSAWPCVTGSSPSAEISRPW
jgi:hypothetical protein